MLTTKDLWPRVAALREVMIDLPPAPSISRHDLVHLAVESFANRGVLKGALLNIPGLPLLGLAPFKGKATVKDLGNGRRLVSFQSETTDDPKQVQLSQLSIRGNAALEAVHARFCADLCAIVASDVSDELLERIAGQGPLVVIESNITKNSRLIETRRYLPTSLDAALSYVLARLIAASRGKRSDLRRCQLESCGVFFFTSKVTGSDGAPRTAYCCLAHGEEQRKKTASARVMKSRKKKQAALASKARKL